MPETDPCIIGMHACGCITYANARPDDLHRDDEREIARFIREGGQVIRTTAGEARAMPHFLVSKCPHTPKGWEPYVEKPFEPHLRPMKRVPGRDRWIVNVAVENWRQGLFAGQVRKHDGAWWATEKWFNEGHGAHNGDHERTPAEVFGPFKTKKEAGEHLVPLAVKRGAELIAQYAAQREAKEARDAA